MSADPSSLASTQLARKEAKPSIPRHVARTKTRVNETLKPMMRTKIPATPAASCNTLGSTF